MKACESKLAKKLKDEGLLKDLNLDGKTVTTQDGEQYNIKLIKNKKENKI